MRLQAAIQGDLHQMMQQEIKDAEGGLDRAFLRAQGMTKGLLRSQIQRAGMGRRLANTWRDKGRRGLLFYRDSPLERTAMVINKASEIIDAHTEGVHIQSNRGGFLAIPSPAAKRRAGRRRKARPSMFPNLTYIRREGEADLLIDASVPRTKRGKLRRGAVMFTLVKDVKLRKSLVDYRQIERLVLNLLPRMILEEYKSTPVRVAN